MLLTEDVLLLLVVHAESKSPQAAAAAASVIGAMLKRMAEPQIEAAPVELLLQAAAAFFSGSTMTARSAGKTIIHRLSAVHGVSGGRFSGNGTAEHI